MIYVYFRRLTVYLKGCRAELQTFLHVLLQLVLDAYLLFFGQRGHWESPDHCLLPYWTHNKDQHHITDMIAAASYPCNKVKQLLWFFFVFVTSCIDRWQVHVNKKRERDSE